MERGIEGEIPKGNLESKMSRFRKTLGLAAVNERRVQWVISDVIGTKVGYAQLSSKSPVRERVAVSMKRMTEK